MYCFKIIYGNYYTSYMETGQIFTKTKLHVVTNLHEDKFGRGHKTARKKFCTESQFRTSYYFAPRIIFS